MEAENDTKIYWEQELIKCKESPYYYATTYLQINGKPFTTILTEDEFNDFFNKSINAVTQD